LDNAERLAPLITANEFGTLFIVTDPQHMRRAMTLLSDALGRGRGIRLVPCPTNAERRAGLGVVEIFKLLRDRVALRARR
jgi:uncharacterized SAM-binding protein YcdF (DUF218 family)